jgi:ActR/RegA family two-component response regulator
MANLSTAKLIGSALIVSDDAMATRHLTEALQELALSVEVCIKVAGGLDRVERTKLEVGVIDFALGDMAPVFLERMRASASNRTAVTFAITSSSVETARALRAGSTFALERPLSLDSIRHTLRAAYGLIVRERRRYFRYPITVPAALSRKAAPEIFGKTANVSESGLLFTAPTPLMPGSEVTAQFSLAEPRISISAECKVRWSNDKGEAGLSFIFLPASSGAELQAWLARRLEEQLGRVGQGLPTAGGQGGLPKPGGTDHVPGFKR